MSSRRWRISVALPLIGALAGVIGCMEAEVGSSKTPEGAEATAQALSREAEDAEGPAGPRAMRPPPGPGGPAFLLVAALHELELTDAQRAAIQGALAKAAPGPEERGPMGPPPFAALAEGVRAGSIDVAAVLAKVEGGARIPEERVAAVAGALSTLHATLTKEQRRALVDAVEKRMVEHGPPGVRGPVGAHTGPADPLEGPLGFLLSGLDLKESQRDAIHRAFEAGRPAVDAAAMQERFEAMRAEMRARIEGFAADAFDAKAFATPPAGEGTQGPRQHLERMVKDVAAVVPILEPAQREALAVMLEKGPPAPGPR